MKVTKILTSSIILLCGNAFAVNQAFMNTQEISPKQAVVVKAMPITKSKHDVYVYNLNQENMVSGTKVNSIWFNVPVVNIIQPPSQSNVSYKLLDGNRAFSFTVTGGMSSTLQFVFIFGNGHPPVTLKFNVADSLSGQVIKIPLTLTGGADTAQAYGSTSHYDQMLIDINKAFTNNKLGNFWTLEQDIKKPYSPYQEFKLSDFKRYSSTTYSMDEWQICSLEPNISLQENEFYRQGSNIVSITLTKHNFYDKNTCGMLFVLSQKPHHEDDTGVLSPVGGEV